MKRYALVVASLMMLWATEAKAITIIEFDTLPGANLSPFTSYPEDGYTVTATGGSWFVAKVFGSPVPAIFAGPIGNIAPSSQITVVETDGSLFTFSGVDLTSNSAVGTIYTVAGFLGISLTPVFTENFQINSINTFETRLVASAASVASVDRVTITGTPGPGVTSFNIDNIRAGAPPDPNVVPEPASLMLLGAGLVGIGIWRRTFVKI